MKSDWKLTMFNSSEENAVKFDAQIESEPLGEISAIKTIEAFNAAFVGLDEVYQGAILDEYDIEESKRIMESVRQKYGQHDPVFGLPDRHPIRKFIRLAVEGSKSPQPELALGAAIVLFGAAASRLYVGPTEGYTNVYVMGLAGSSAGKDKPMRNAMEILAEGAPQLLGGSGVKSGRALISLLERQPAAALFIDEGGEVFGEAAAEGAGEHNHSIGSAFTSLYSASQGLYAGDNYANQSEKPKVPIYNPCVSLFSVSNPVSYYEGLTERAMVNGNLARYLLVEASQNHPNRNRKRPHPELRDELVAIVATIREGTHCQPAPKISDDDMKAAGVSMEDIAAKGIDLAIARIKPFKVEYQDDAAAKLGQGLEDYERYEKRFFEEQGFSGIVGRTVEGTMKLATIAAVAEFPKNPRVSEAHLIWANQIVRKSVARLIKAASSDISDTPEGRLRNKIANFITSKGKQGAMKSEITTHARNCKGGGTAIDAALKMLATMETFAAQNERPKGRKITVWYSVKHLSAAQSKRVDD
jgi:hypothetical protein